MELGLQQHVRLDEPQSSGGRLKGKHEAVRNEALVVDRQMRDRGDRFAERFRGLACVASAETFKAGATGRA